MRSAKIFKNDIFCGILTEDEEGYHFVYDESYLVTPDAKPLSPTMPLTGEPYGGTEEIPCWLIRRFYGPPSAFQPDFPSMVVHVMDHHERFSRVMGKTDGSLPSGGQPEIRGAAGCAFGSGVGHGWPLSEAKWAGVEAQCATEGRRTGVSPLREFRVGREGGKGNGVHGSGTQADTKAWSSLGDNKG